MLTQRKKRKWIVLPVAMALLLLFFAHVADISPIENAVTILTSPFTAVTLKASDGASMAFQAFFDLKDISAENVALREENRQFARERAQRMDLEKENEALRKQIGVEQKDRRTLVAAQIAHFDPLSFSYFAVINKGTRAGVKQNMPVVMAGDIVLGKIVEAHEEFSRVMLISNIGNKVSVKTATEKASGVLAGVEGKALRMDLIEKSAEIGTDELVVTSGLDGVYPRGLVVGWVKDVIAPEEGIFKQASVRPAFEEGFSTTVFIITDYLQ